MPLARSLAAALWRSDLEIIVDWEPVSTSALAETPSISRVMCGLGPTTSLTSLVDNTVPTWASKHFVTGTSLQLVFSELCDVLAAAH